MEYFRKRVAGGASPSSIATILLLWATLQLGGLFSPGLLDDVDSIYIQIAREMLGRHDFVTPYIDGIRFFDKPPLMYWLAAGSMRIFGAHDWAARLPLALGVLALLFAVYGLGNFLFRRSSDAVGPPADRAGLYAAMILAASIGPYLYTRFFIPDILICLWMTLSVHLLLVALERIAEGRSALLPMLGFGAITALNILTKGLIGVVFPIAFALVYVAVTRRLRLLARLQIPAATGLFLLIAAPWHILAALRNPAIPMPAGMGLPARAGWAWFYLYNEHIARFLSRRIPHDYGQTPVWLFWLLAALWIFPWATFLPAAIVRTVRQLRGTASAHADSAPSEHGSRTQALVPVVWAGVVLIFFTLSARQEYYSLPALPALALLIAGLLADADQQPNAARAAVLAGSRWVLLPVSSIIAVLCGYLAITAHRPAPGAVLDKLLSSNPEMYNLSLGHVFDLTGEAMGFFRGPLVAVCLGMAVLGLGSHLLRRSQRTYAANLALAAGMTVVLMAAHEGLVRFYPILGSQDLAEVIKADGLASPILIDGELTSASSVLFYLDNPVLLVNGRVNGPWFGSFWPDARPIFLNDTDLFQQWHWRTSVYLLTYEPAKRAKALCTAGPVFELATAGGEAVLRNTAPKPDAPGKILGHNLCSALPQP